MFVYSKYHTGSSKSKVRKIKSRPRFQSRRFGLWLFVVTTTLLIVLRIATWLNAEELFTLHRVIIQGNSALNDAHIIQLLETKKTSNLFQHDLRELSRKLKQHPYVKEASVSRRLPDNLIVQITENEPVALLTSPLRLVDEQGLELPQMNMFQHLDFPLIKRINPDNKAWEKELNLILNYLSSCKAENFTIYSQISEISYSPEAGIFFYLVDSGIPVIVGRDLQKGQNQHLMQVLSILKNKNEIHEVKAFDIRFSNQVIVKTKVS